MVLYHLSYLTQLTNLTKYISLQNDSYFEASVGLLGFVKPRFSNQPLDSTYLQMQYATLASGYVFKASYSKAARFEPSKLV